MGKTKKEFTKTSKLLLRLVVLAETTSPLASKYELGRFLLYGKKRSYEQTLRRMCEKGWIQMVDKNAEKFVKLTSRGELEALIRKAQMPSTGPWDGKWRLVIYDIPEEQNKKRDLLRRLLHNNNFYQLQASVYVTPFPLNREAVKYLEEKKLNSFIRIIKVEEMDNDRDLRKHFNLL